MEGDVEMIYREIMSGKIQDWFLISIDEYGVIKRAYNIFGILNDFENKKVVIRIEPKSEYIPNPTYWKNFVMRY